MRFEIWPLVRFVVNRNISPVRVLAHMERDGNGMTLQNVFSSPSELFEKIGYEIVETCPFCETFGDMLT